MKKVNITFDLIRRKARYFFALAAVFLAVIVNNSFPATVITSESCIGSCKATLENPVLTKNRMAYYVNDIMKSVPGQYYRLTFRERANDDSKILIKMTNPSNNEKELKTMALKKTMESVPQEILFSADGNYTDVLFEKTNPDDADIDISEVQVSQLNISSEHEFENFTPTIMGSININAIDQSQTDNIYSFDQLKEGGVIFGQIFKSGSEYITGVSLDMDIIKQSNVGGKKYKLELRKADFDGSVYDVTSDVLYSESFTVDGLEKFRQEDGKFKFPIFAKLKKDEYYFIGINNDRVNVDKYNYLKIKGARDGSKYENGMLAIKTKGKTYSIPGDLYFVTYALAPSEYNGKRVLGGEIIEDLGGKKGNFTYRQLGGIYDLADLDGYSPDIRYDSEKNALAGTAMSGTESYMTYKFDTIFPIRTIKIFGRQADAGWSKASLYYSFDKKNWEEIPSREDDGLQNFDSPFDVNGPYSSVYLKIVPKDFSEKQSYGITGLKVEAELVTK